LLKSKRAVNVAFGVPLTGAGVPFPSSEQAAVKNAASSKPAITFIVLLICTS
jgi:hypothetical protein